ncbi:LysR family transcriptional regulator [Roseivivax sediminis]|uniref:DNA-binding transcriptional regulator, LysR family n=1 Tax=Roseivivax sediminis TaxID=936889 RepID=A0A1I1YQH2_9RHOB|nr:LysR family transcriptional regulator [Roseivivax sediminis]SFE21699.1 DNA-binding transcriptional regulator, LysR family [Roseivivax sediminis]
MDNWDDLRFLVALSKAGTMTAAAKHLGTNTATVSRRIERLSEQLGTPAFIKTTDGWRPSDAVVRLIEVAQAFDGTLQSVLNDETARHSNEPVKISIGSIPIVTSQVLIPGLQRHGSMLDGVSITFTDRVFREGLGENDLVVMYGQPDSGRIVTRKAGQLSFRLYQQKDVAISDSWAGLGEAHDAYPPMQQGFARFARAPKIRVDSFIALFSLMKMTGLPGPLPDVLAAQDPAFVPLELEPTHAPFQADFWLMFHETRRSDPAMRTVVEWIATCFEDIAQANQSVASAT